VGNGERPGRFLPLLQTSGEPVFEAGEIRPAVGKKIFKAPERKTLQLGLGHFFHIRRDPAFSIRIQNDSFENSRDSTGYFFPDLCFREIFSAGR
jgi:hypothetical protein